MCFGGWVRGGREGLPPPFFVDEFTRKMFGFPLARKSDAARKIMEWCHQVEAQKGVKVVEFHTEEEVNSSTRPCRTSSSRMEPPPLPPLLTLLSTTALWNV